MKKFLLTTAIILAALVAVAPQSAEARVFVSARFGGCCWGGGYYPYPYYSPYYSPYYYPEYVAPPPVVYAVPPAPPTVYADPEEQVIAAPPPQAPAPAPAAVPARNSGTFIDSQGRTCRHFQSGPASGVVCLQPDGTWKTVD